MIKLIKFVIIGIFLTVANASAKEPEILLPNIGLYLSQGRCVDSGSSPYLESGCIALPQNDHDSMWWRRTDIGKYQVTDSVIAPERGQWLQTWSYEPFGFFRPDHGDGGHTIVVEDGVAKITATQDASLAGMRVLPEWAVFDAWTTYGKWRQVDRYGRARRETIRFPASGYPWTWLTEIIGDTIISEHYDCFEIGKADCSQLERMYFVAANGLTYWQAWVPKSRPVPAVEQARRCPQTGIAFAGPPAEHADWILYDCRLWTNFVRWDGKFSAKLRGWPE